MVVTWRAASKVKRKACIPLAVATMTPAMAKSVPKFETWVGGWEGKLWRGGEVVVRWRERKGKERCVYVRMCLCARKFPQSTAEVEISPLLDQVQPYLIDDLVEILWVERVDGSAKEHRPLPKEEEGKERERERRRCVSQWSNRCAV
jgi:hypothetical protein